MSWRQRLQAYPTQLTLTLAWIIIGTPVSLILRNSILWVSLMSLYAIVITHWTGHLAWRAEQAAEHE